MTNERPMTMVEKFRGPQKKRTTEEVDPGATVELSGPELFEQAKETTGATFVTKEHIESAQTLEQVISAFYGTDGLAYKPKSKVMVFTEKHAQQKIDDILYYLKDLAENSPLSLKQSSDQLGENFPKFAAIPAEKGLRAHVMKLYDDKRKELAGSLDMTVAPSESVPKNSPAAEINKVDKDAAAKPEVKLKDLELKISREELENLANTYLDQVNVYRKLLKNAYEKIKDEEYRPGPWSWIKRTIMHRTPEISEDEQEELRMLRGQASQTLSELGQTIKENIIAKGGKDEDVNKGMAAFRVVVGELTKEQVKQGKMLQTNATAEYERIIFTKVTADPMVSSDEREKHGAYLEKKRAEAELNKAAGAFISPDGTKSGGEIKQKNIQEKNVKEDGSPVTKESSVTNSSPAEQNPPAVTQPQEKQEVPVVVPNTGKEKETVRDKEKEQTPEGISPEKTVAAISAIQKLKLESKRISTRAKKLVEEKGETAYSAVLIVAEKYKNLPKNKKIALICGIASITALGLALSSPLLISTALVAKTVQRGLLGASATLAVEKALADRAERHRVAGKDEDWITKRKELLAVGTGLAAIILPRIISGEVAQLVRDTHVTEHVKGWFSSFGSTASIAHDKMAELVNPDINSARPEDFGSRPPLTPPSSPDAIEPSKPAMPAAPLEPVPTPIQAAEISVPETGTSNAELVSTPSAPESSTAPETTEAPSKIPIAKRAVIINDSLGKKGDSIWGSLRSNGVSEKAIANYEKAHPGEIMRKARNGDIITFSYDKKTGILKDVQFERAAGKAAKKMANIVVENHQPKDITPTSAQIEKPSTSSVIEEKQPGKNLEEKPAEKTTEIKKNIAETRPTKEKISKIKIGSTLETRLPQVDASGSITTPTAEAAPENSFINLIDGNTQGVTFTPFETTGLANANPAVNTEINKYFATTNDKTWTKISRLDASRALKVKSAEELRGLMGKGATLEDARKGRDLLTLLSKESGLKPARKDYVYNYMANAVEKLSKVVKK